jgi:anti-sigma regulatory factor (Ser/Thr protein kinase)
VSEANAVVPLDNHTSAAGFARRRVRELIGDHDRIDDLLLCVSEVVTNAVIHAGTLTHLTFVCDDDVVRVEVVDRSPAKVPRRAEPGPASESGRGIRLVDLLADRWGVAVDPRQKSVWFEFDAVN